MPYYIVRVLIRISFITYFRKLYFIDSQKVPKKAPIIFAANHPTAFLEPIMHAPYLDHVTYFILRGDYFESKWAKKVLSSLKIVPIFRQRDGMEKMRQNANLFGMFQDMLHEKKNLTIMVEGSHDHRKHLRKVQRGTARMALGTYKEYGDEDITILPMGVTFSDVQSVRSVAMIKFGEPIPLKDYLELYAQNERKAMLNITKDIQTRLRPCLVHLEDLEHYENTNFVLDMYRNTQQLDLWKPFSKNATHVEAEISLAERINQIPNIEALAHEVKTYQKQLQNVGVKDLGLGKQEQFNIATTLTLLLLLPIFSIITLVHSPLIALVHFLKNKMK
ncbi:MAG: 1-acyl-sn-glycerol-3-phosphate acyltransferase, partial [Bacteroidota bacterium]